MIVDGTVYVLQKESYLLETCLDNGAAFQLFLSSPNYCVGKRIVRRAKHQSEGCHGLVVLIEATEDKLQGKSFRRSSSWYTVWKNREIHSHERNVS